MNTFQQLQQYLGDPSSWFALGALIVVFTYIVLYDMAWTFGPNTWSDFWFHRIQVWLKLAVFGAALTFILLVGFTPWPVNLLIVVSSALAVTGTIIWLRNRGQQNP